MRKSVFLLMVVGGLLAVSPPASGAISFMNVTTVGGTFVASGGLHGLGIMTVAKNPVDIVVEDVLGAQTTYVGGQFLMSTSLFADESSGGMVRGDFQGGAISFKDNGGNALLSGTMSGLLLQEQNIWTSLPGLPPLLTVYLTGTGVFDVTGGSLQADWAMPQGLVVEIKFNLAPRNPSDLSSG
ncbi:MAG TPA: hypothetical protein VLH60_02000, partial [Sedimentisphaerales bacterium]|nr:hypothetical protein [Sedimentisphaerales bacterium]